MLRGFLVFYPSYWYAKNAWPWPLFIWAISQKRFAASNLQGWGTNVFLWDRVGLPAASFKTADSPSLGLHWTPPALGVTIHLGPSASPSGNWVSGDCCDMLTLWWLLLLGLIKPFKTDSEVMCLQWASLKPWWVNLLARRLAKISDASQCGQHDFI